MTCEVSRGSWFRMRLANINWWVRWLPRVIITDKLKSHEAARKALTPGIEHRQHKGVE